MRTKGPVVVLREGLVSGGASIGRTAKTFFCAFLPQQDGLGKHNTAVPVDHRPLRVGCVGHPSNKWNVPPSLLLFAVQCHRTRWSLERQPKTPGSLRRAWLPWEIVLYCRPSQCNPPQHVRRSSQSRGNHRSTGHFSCSATSDIEQGDRGLPID